jgi:RNA polymerase sigma factor (TIGR02999 family)
MLSASKPNEITALLRRLSAGDRDAEAVLVPQVYQNLRGLAAAYLRRERPDHTLQPTALVHEAYIRLIGAQAIQWQDRSHFFRVAASVMRRILVDDARNRKANKRGGGQIKIPIEDSVIPSAETPDLLIDVDAALVRLSKIDARQAKVVELRFFGGLSEEEIASCLEISSRTVKREWVMAKAWLRGELVR